MTRFLFILCLIFSLDCSSQRLSKKENFINEIKFDFVDSTFSYYCLFYKCSPLFLNDYEIKHVENDFKEFLPDSTLKFIISSAKADTLPELWNCIELTKSKCIDENFIDYGPTVVTYANWNENKKERELKRQTKKYNQEQKRKPKRDKQIFYFSRPSFSSNKQFAIISIWVSYSPQGGNGCIYLFKKINGKWTKLAKTNCMMS